MNLKDKRYYIDWYDSAIYDDKEGSQISCNDVVYYINHLLYKLELSKEEVLDKLIQELS